MNPDRLQISGVEIRLRRLGRELNIPKVHPHKFRRTLATMALFIVLRRHVDITKGII